MIASFPNAGLQWQRVQGRTWQPWICAVGCLDLMVKASKTNYSWTVSRDGLVLASGVVLGRTRGICGVRAAKWRCTRAANLILKGGQNGHHVP